MTDNSTENLDEEEISREALGEIDSAWDRYSHALFTPDTRWSGNLPEQPRDNHPLPLTPADIRQAKALRSEPPASGGTREANLLLPDER